MSENKKLELLDQYDDVTFALLMDEYAEEEGARLRKEFEEAQAAGEVADTSDALDEKCLQMIHRDFAKKRGKENVRKIIRMTSKVAVAVMVFLCAATATIFSVDALRIPVLNYLISHYSNSSIIDFDGPDQPQATISDFPEILIPSGFSEVYSELVDGLPSCMYTNDAGDFIMFYMAPTEGKHAFDSEDAIVEEIVFLDYAAIYVYEDTKKQLLWFDDDNMITYSCITEGLSEDVFFAVCTDFAKQYGNYGG